MILKTTNGFLLNNFSKRGLFCLVMALTLIGCRTQFGGDDQTLDGGPDATCGNGVLDDGEECDDGNAENGDGCDPECRVEQGWQCTGEPSDCEETCGDGIKEEWEECDGEDLGGNTCETLGEGFKGGELRCTDECTYETYWCISPSCGDGVLDFGEECDNGEENSNEGECLVNCVKATCGDGFVWGGEEECDEGGENSDTQPDACRTNCRAAWCGDGVIDSSETCDNGPENSDTEPDACRTDCRAAWCGDGVIDSGETCDNGPENSDTEPNACRTNCLPASCGDGVLDTGEECDNGGANSDTASDACRTNCRLPRCGDGVVDTGEDCDDGNNISGDGCSWSCEMENLPVLHWVSNSSTGWNNETVYFANDNHAPTNPIIAAANVQERNEIYVFTRTTYHVLSVPGRNWIAHGTLSSTFSGLPTSSFTSAYGTSDIGTESTPITIIAGWNVYIYWVSTSGGHVFADNDNPINFSWDGDPNAPNAQDLKASYVALENGQGWADCWTHDYCYTEVRYGVFMTETNSFYIQHADACFTFCPAKTASQFTPFSLAGSPSPSLTRAMAFANGVLYVFTQSN